MGFHLNAIDDSEAYGAGGGSGGMTAPALTHAVMVAMSASLSLSAF